MCIFSQPVVSVTDTNIFARLAKDGWQHLVYQMNFETKSNNAIVLPLPVKLPVKEGKSLEFVSLEGHDNFFKDLKKGFPVVLPKGPTRSGSLDIASNQAKLLKVHDVGDFIASFVPSIPDFDRLDKQFRIKKDSWDLLPNYADYGFAVFQLKELKGKPHPMAFKFQSRLGAAKDPSIFFPTVHIHDGEVHAREEFDHSLFLQANEYDQACGEYKKRGMLVTDPATGYVRSKWKAKEFCDIKKSKGIIDGDLLVHRLEMRGRLKNEDVLAKLNLPRPFRNEFKLGSLGLGGSAIAAGVAGILGMSWFFNRRDEVAGKPGAAEKKA